MKRLVIFHSYVTLPEGRKNDGTNQVKSLGRLVEVLRFLGEKHHWLPIGTSRDPGQQTLAHTARSATRKLAKLVDPMTWREHEAAYDFF